MIDITLGTRKLISLEKLLLFAAMLTILIPTRGEIMGIGGPTFYVLFCAIAIMIKKGRKTKIPKYYIIYLMITLVCIFVHFSERAVFIHIIACLDIIGFCFLASLAIENREDFFSFIRFIVAVFAIYAFFGIIESLLHFNIFDVLTGTSVEYTYANQLRFGLARSRGACDVSINNGMMLCMALCIAAYAMINADKREKKVFTAAYILIFINCFLTLSRGIWIDVLISQGLIFISQRPMKQVISIMKLLALAFVAVIVCAVAAPSVLTSVGNITDSMVNSVIDIITGGSSSDLQGEGDRILLWGWVWSTVQDSLLWGKGYASEFAYLTSQGAVKESIEVMWLRELYKTGLVGMFGYIFFQLGTLIYTFKKREKGAIKKGKIGFNQIVLIICISYFITQFSCSCSEDLRFFYCIVGLLFVYNKECGVEMDYGRSMKTH